MNLIVFNNPADLPWQTNLCDLMLLAMVVQAVGLAVMSVFALFPLYARRTDETSPAFVGAVSSR